MFIQDTPVSKDAKLLSTDKSACMQSELEIYGLVSKAMDYEPENYSGSAVGR
jgi:hypothetical protein